MRSEGNPGTGYSGSQHEPRSTISRWRVGPNEHPLNSLGESAAPGRAGDSPMVTAVPLPQAETPPVVTVNLPDPLGAATEQSKDEQR